MRVFENLGADFVAPEVVHKQHADHGIPTELVQ